MHTRKIFIRYCAEMSGAFLLYALALWVAHDIGFHMQTGIARTLVLVCPSGPSCASFSALMNTAGSRWWKPSRLRSE